MKYIVPLLFFGILLSCSKQGNDATTTTDSTASSGIETSPSGREVSLTEEQMQRVNFQIFLQLHNENLYDGDYELTAYKEDFTTNGNEFTYVLLRHNGRRSGWHFPSEFVEQSEAGSEGEEEGSKSDPYGETDSYGETEEQPEEEQTFTNEIDTIRIQGKYTAISDDAPEAPLKTVTIIMSGKKRFMNYPYETYGEVKTYVDESDFYSELIAEVFNPLSIHRYNLFLKAKIADLTEQDLAGISKEELGFVRNEIFARHGHTFKTDKMINYFSQMPWYHSLVDDAVSLLNKFEKRNVDFIKKMEG